MGKKWHGCVEVLLPAKHFAESLLLAGWYPSMPRMPISMSKMSRELYVQLPEEPENQPPVVRASGGPARGTARSTAGATARRVASAARCEASAVDRGADGGPGFRRPLNESCGCSPSSFNRGLLRRTHMMSSNDNKCGPTVDRKFLPNELSYQRAILRLRKNRQYTRKQTRQT